MLGGCSAEHCALPIATHEQSRLGLFTDEASSVLATAEAEDAARVGEVEEQRQRGRGRKGLSKWLLCCYRHLAIFNGNGFIQMLRIMMRKIRQQMVHIYLATVVNAAAANLLIRYFCSAGIIFSF